jgi:ribosome recycling factor
MDSIADAKKIIAGSLDTKFIQKSFGKIDTIKKNTSTLDTIALLKYVDDPKDLQKVANVSKKYKKNTKAVFKVLGEGVIKGIVKGTEKVVKITSMLIAQAISLAVSAVLFLFTLVGKLFTWRIFRAVPVSI